MKERPIRFNGDMVRAILEGRKSQTRPVIKDNEGPNLPSETQEHRELIGKPYCPYGQPGDRLWVRETHFINHYKGAQTPVEDRLDVEILYRATDMDYVRNLEDSEWLVWKPSIHMPRWASRITLEVVNVRVERLQNITVSDAIAEGYDGSNSSAVDPSIKWYADFWESINGPGSWSKNPWVWVIEFRRLP